MARGEDTGAHPGRKVDAASHAARRGAGANPAAIKRALGDATASDITLEDMSHGGRIQASHPHAAPVATGEHPEVAQARKLGLPMQVTGELVHPSDPRFSSLTVGVNAARPYDVGHARMNAEMRSHGQAGPQRYSEEEGLVRLMHPDEDPEWKWRGEHGHLGILEPPPKR